jgi:acyl carrier protein
MLKKKKFNQSKQEKIIVYLKKNLFLKKSKAEKNFNFLKSQDLDSLDIITMISKVEKKYLIKFTSRDYKTKNFGDINILAKIILNKI